MTYTGRVHRLNLPAFDWYGYGGHRSASTDEVKEYLRVMTVINDRLQSDEPVYIRFDDGRRAGSVAKIVSCDFQKETSHSWYSRYTKPDYDRIYIDNIVAKWDGRSNKVSPYRSEIEFLEDWTEGTKWAWTVKAPGTRTIPTIEDHLGEEVQVNDFVSFVSKKYGYVNLHFGNVSRINFNGTVWVNTLKLRDEDVPQEMKVHDTDTIVKIGKDLIDRLMMARLAVK